MTVAERLARHVLGTRYEDLPSSAVRAAKTFLLDALAVGIAGSSAENSALVRAAASRWGNTPEATVLGTSLRLPAPCAAFVNAYQMHCQEFDCIHEAAVVHAMSALTPAVLAGAERNGGVSGRDLLSALVLGVDVAVTLGLNLDGDWRFFRPATAGAFGAVAALGRLAGITAPTLVDAFGVMLGQVSGTMQPHTEGRPLLPLQIGFSARNAVMAVDLAQAGLTGTRETFEGKHGYFALYEGSWDPTSALDKLGERFRITELSHKPFPCGRATHGLIDGLLQLRAEHRFSSEDVDRVMLLASPLVIQLVARPVLAGMSPSYARLCARYVGALALLQGTVRIEDFALPSLGDIATLALAQRIEIAVDESAASRALLPQSLAVRLQDGRVRSRTLTAVLGSPERPLTHAQAVEKFETCWSSAEALVPEHSTRVIELVERLETLDTVEPIIRLCAP